MTDNKTAADVTIEAIGDAITVTFNGHGDAGDCSGLVAGLVDGAPRRVQLVCDFGIPGAAWARAIAKQQLPTVTAFIFDTDFQTATRQGENSVGDLAVTLAALPAVERVFATGKSVLSPLRHESVRELHLVGDPLPAALLDGLAGSELPQLERLVLSLAGDHEGPSALAVAKAVAKLRAPKLREVHIDGVDDIAAALPGLATLPASVRVVSLNGAIDDEDTLFDVLRTHAARFGKLEMLTLPLGDWLSSDAEEAARQIVPCVKDGDDAELFVPAAYANW